MGKRLYARQTNGRFVRPTLSNTLGLKAYVCEDCHRLNPVAVGEPQPKQCHACGSANLA